jgi:hypothetical protein
MASCSRRIHRERDPAGGRRILCVFKCLSYLVEKSGALEAEVMGVGSGLVVSGTLDLS